MNFLFVSTDPIEGCIHKTWRCSPLARAIQRITPHSAQLVGLEACLNPDRAIQDLVEASDQIIIQGTPSAPILDLIQHWKARGKTVIVDVSPSCFDHLSSESHPQSIAVDFETRDPAPDYSAFIRSLSTRDEFYWGLRLASAALFSSPRLADDWRLDTKAYVLPDYIDLDRYLNITPIPHEGVIIGWNNDTGDPGELGQSGILEALERLLNRLPYLRLLTWGSQSELIDQLKISPEQKVDPASLGCQDWPRPLSCVDIGLAPVAGFMSERRGWMDVLEFMVMKIPWLASESPTYYQLRPYGWLVQNSANAWERVLQDMIDHLNDYQFEAAGEAYLFGLSQGVDENAEKTVELLTMIHQQSPVETKSNLVV